MTTAHYVLHEPLAPATMIDTATSALTRVARPTGLPSNDAARSIRRVGIIGTDAARMAIAMHLLEADIPVTLYNSRHESTVQAVALVRNHYEQLVNTGRLAAEQRDRRMALITGATNFHHLKDCDLIFTAPSEEMHAAQELFQRLDDLVQQDTILLTDHAIAGIDHLASCTRRAANVMGMRFPNRADPLGSFELVRGRESSEEAFAIVGRLLKKIRKPIH